MKSLVSLLAVSVLMCASMQVVVAKPLERGGVKKPVATENKNIPYVDINPFMEKKRLAQDTDAKQKSDSVKKKRFMPKRHTA